MVALPPVPPEPAGSPMAQPMQRSPNARSAGSLGSSGARRGKASSTLPPIAMLPKTSKLAPLTFEDLYTTAKTRVGKKAAVVRKGGCAEHLLSKSATLPAFPAAQSGKAAYPGSDPRAAKAPPPAAPLLAIDPRLTPPQLETPPSGDAWADQALAAASAGASPAGRRLSRQSSPLEGQSPVTPGLERQLSLDEEDGAASVVTEQPEAAEPTIMDERLNELKEVIANLANGSTDFSPQAIQRFASAFHRFKLPGESDLHKDDLTPVLEYLGHVMTKAEGVRAIADELTQFEYLDFEEFLNFMEKFVEFERGEFQKVFQEYDEDGSGAISTEELRKLTSHLGFITLRGMMSEALAYVDADSNGELNFQEFITFLAIYNHSEGFTNNEVTDLHQSFDRLSMEVQVEGSEAPQKVIPPDDLSDALVAVFGLQVGEFAEPYCKQLASGRGLLDREPDEDPMPTNLEFGEFLIVARKIRQAQRDEFGREFARFCAKGRSVAEGTSEEDIFALVDADGSGGIGMEEIRGLLIANNFTPLIKVIDEIHAEVFEPGGAPGSELDFDEFFDFMLIFRLRDGFLLSELARFKDLFNAFDEDGSGEVSALELAEMLRHLGYRVAVEDLQALVLQVDENGSGQLDYREYIRLMRLFREQYLVGFKKAFEKHRCGQECLPPAKLGAMLKEIGQDIPKGLVDAPPAEPISFDNLVEIADESRQELVELQRRMAGFTDAEIAHFQELFDKFDKDKSGDIDTMELLIILQEFDYQPKSKAEQIQLMNKLDQSREKAREAGVTDVAEEGSTVLKFWTFVQLMRRLRTDFDEKQVALQEALQKELFFSEGEIEEFRQIFRNWYKRMRDLEMEMAGEDPSAVQETSVGAKKVEEEITKDGCRRLMRSLGCSLTPQMAIQLDEKVGSLDTEAESGRREKINFFGFLGLMRWLMDNDFAGINLVVSKGR